MYRSEKNPLLLAVIEYTCGPIRVDDIRIEPGDRSKRRSDDEIEEYWAHLAPDEASLPSWTEYDAKAFASKDESLTARAGTANVSAAVEPPAMEEVEAHHASEDVESQPAAVVVPKIREVGALTDAETEGSESRSVSWDSHGTVDSTFTTATVSTNATSCSSDGEKLLGQDAEVPAQVYVIPVEGDKYAHIETVSVSMAGPDDPMVNTKPNGCDGQ